LIEQRLEGVMVAAIHNCHLNRQVRQSLGCSQSGKAAADDYDAGAAGRLLAC
jgi:hypothetical protein